MDNFKKPSADNPPLNPGPHLTSRQSRELAETGNGPLSERLVELWQHVRKCKECFEEVESFRQMILSTTDQKFPEINLSFDDIKEEMKEKEKSVSILETIATEFKFVLSRVGDKIRLLVDNHERTLVPVPVKGPSALYADTIKVDVNDFNLNLKINKYDPEEIKYLLSISFDEMAEVDPLPILRVEIEHQEKGMIYSKKLREDEEDLPPLSRGKYKMNFIQSKKEIGSIRFSLEA